MDERARRKSQLTVARDRLDVECFGLEGSAEVATICLTPSAPR
jgi:hypothetical protein